MIASWRISPRSLPVNFRTSRCTRTTLRLQLEEARAAANERENQLEEDADLEIDELKEKYELRLKEQRDVSLRLKGKSGIMKKKFTTMQKSIAEQKDEIAGLFTDKKNRYATIADLEKDVAALSARSGTGTRRSGTRRSESTT